MLRLFWIFLIFALSAASAPASVCDAASGSSKTAQARWRIDHYAYDASLKRDWEVLVDCEHPGTPARMKLAPEGAHPPISGTYPGAGVGRVANSVPSEPEPEPIQHFANSQPPIAIKVGESVEVSSAPDAVARILLSGTAMEAGRLGQRIRVRIDASGRYLSGTVHGPHSVELAAAAKPAWGKP